MNGNERRFLEIRHPELFKTSDEVEYRKMIVKNMYGFCKSMYMSFMIIYAILVIYIATFFTGFVAMMIVLLGTLSDIVITMMFAHRLGKKMEKLL